MTRLITTIVVSTIFCANVVAQKYDRSGGYPIITNFEPEKYNAEDQNWAIAQDDRGLIYIGNNKGVLEWDGSNWRLIRTRNDSYIRSLMKADDGRIMVGAVNEFGYLYPDARGCLTYKSLSEQLGDNCNCEDIYRIYGIDDKVYMCSWSYVYEIVGDSIMAQIALPEESQYTFLMDDALYFFSRANGEQKLYIIENGTTRPVADYDEAIYGAEQLRPGQYLISGRHKYTVFDTRTHTFTPITSSYTERIRKEMALPYTQSKIGDDSYAFSYIFSDDNALTIADSLMNPKYILNTRVGLMNNLATSSKLTGDNVLWITLNKGIARAEVGSCIKMYSKESGIESQITDIIEFNDELYIATFDGVERLVFDGLGNPYFKPVSGINVSAYLFQTFKTPDGNEKLLVITQSNICEIKGDNATIIDHAGGRLLHQSAAEPSILLIGGHDGLRAKVYNNGAWSNKALDTNISGSIRNMKEDAQGNLWLMVYMHGVYEITNQGEIRHYDEQNGLPQAGPLQILDVDGRLVFFNEAGAYEFSSIKKQFVPSETFNVLGNDGNTAMLPCHYAGGYAVSCNSNGNKRVEILKRDENGNLVVEGTALRRLPNIFAEVVYADKKGRLWIGQSNTLYSYTPDNSLNPYYKESFNAHIRQVTVRDSLIFGGAFCDDEGHLSARQRKDFIPELTYNDNSVDITYSATFFEKEESTEYSVMLEGADKEWSHWTTRTLSSYNNLFEGTYTFKVKARNIYGVESQVEEFTFVVKPPFYRTIWAYIIYAALFFLAIRGIIKVNTARLEKDKKRLQAEVDKATEKIRDQMEEIESQKDEIESQRDEIQASINYARRIQRALLTPNEVIDKIFPDHFLLFKPRNVVSGDYYWFGEFGDYKVAIVADCTGHGVPGGFVSMLGMTNLNYIVGNELSPDKILNKLREAIIKGLRQDGVYGIPPLDDDDLAAMPGSKFKEKAAAKAAQSADEASGAKRIDRSQDGMDVSMYVLNSKTLELSFAGANNPLIVIRKGAEEPEVIKADKMPVGIYLKLEPFTKTDIQLEHGDCLYSFSDGFQDQFGYETKKKFLSKKLRELLFEVHELPMEEQRKIIEARYLAWRGPKDNQTDDMVLFGLRV